MATTKEEFLRKYEAELQSICIQKFMMVSMGKRIQNGWKTLPKKDQFEVIQHVRQHADVDIMPLLKELE